LPVDSFGGVAVIEFVRDAESICSGAFLKSADLIPACVRSVTVSLWFGGVTALGAIVAMRENMGSSSLARSYTMVLKKFDQESPAFLSHGREQTHFP
jgi:hypothetical protein